MTNVEEYIFPHKCEHDTCTSMVTYDDEPWCFIHSPDSGSSVRGYSARRKAGDLSHKPWR
jgi:hypothetical protein